MLRLISEGLDNAQIAEQLVISVNTVKSHAHHLMNKLDASSRMHAAPRRHGHEHDARLRRRLHPVRDGHAQRQPARVGRERWHAAVWDFGPRVLRATARGHPDRREAGIPVWNHDVRAAGSDLCGSENLIKEMRTCILD